jgi:hypothetical protein
MQIWLDQRYILEVSYCGWTVMNRGLLYEELNNCTLWDVLSRPASRE